MNSKQVVRLLSPIEHVELIASGSSLRERDRLVEKYGEGRWRKLKGVAYVEDNFGNFYRAEVHWYEAHGIGKRDMKIKQPL